MPRRPAALVRAGDDALLPLLRRMIQNGTALTTVARALHRTYKSVYLTVLRLRARGVLEAPWNWVSPAHLRAAVQGTVRRFPRLGTERLRAY
eukprot:gene635-6995_t